MASKMFALIGNWHYVPGPRGYTIYSYDRETANMQLIETVFPDAWVGHQCVGQNRNTVYLCNEIGDCYGSVGGGGYILTVSIDPKTGTPVKQGETRSFCSTPAGFCVDATGKYGIAVHFAGFGHVTKLVKTSLGGYDTVTLFDDVAVVLFRMNEDGCIGDVCNAYVLDPDDSVQPCELSHLHCVVPTPDGDKFIVSDKGRDKLYTFRLDYENEQLHLISQLKTGHGTSPRYGVFHPTLPLFYSNNEKTTELFTSTYNSESGRLNIVAQTNIQAEENQGKPGEPSDIVIHSNGKFLYVSDRGSHFIAVFSINQEGELTLIQNIPCGGTNPRGMCLSPDERFLLVANSDSKNLAVFTVENDGRLSLLNDDIPAICPANIRFVAADD